MIDESPSSKSTAYYKVERQLRDVLPHAFRPQQSGVSADLRLYFREKEENGRRVLWGGLAILGVDGKIVANMPLADESSLPWLLGVVCELGFAAAPERRIEPL